MRTGHVFFEVTVNDGNLRKKLDVEFPSGEADASGDVVHTVEEFVDERWQAELVAKGVPDYWNFRADFECKRDGEPDGVNVFDVFGADFGANAVKACFFVFAGIQDSKLTPAMMSIHFEIRSDAV